MHTLPRRRWLAGTMAGAAGTVVTPATPARAADDPSLRAEMIPPFLVDEALETPVESRAATLAAEIAGSLGLEREPVGVPYGSDASKLSRHGLDCLVFGPGSIDQAHGAVEFVDIAQVELAAEFYREFCRTYD